jgi:ribosomal protein L27
MTFVSGPGTGLARDYTVFATQTGRVRFEHVRRDKKRIRIVAEPASSEVTATGA